MAPCARSCWGDGGGPFGKIYFRLEFDANLVCLVAHPRRAGLVGVATIEVRLYRGHKASCHRERVHSEERQDPNAREQG